MEMNLKNHLGKNIEFNDNTHRGSGYLIGFYINKLKENILIIRFINIEILDHSKCNPINGEVISIIFNESSIKFKENFNLSINPIKKQNSLRNIFKRPTNDDIDLYFNYIIKGLEMKAIKFINIGYHVRFNYDNKNGSGFIIGFYRNSLDKVCLIIKHDGLKSTKFKEYKEEEEIVILPIYIEYKEKIIQIVHEIK